MSRENNGTLSVTLDLLEIRSNRKLLPIFSLFLELNIYKYYYLLGGNTSFSPSRSTVTQLFRSTVARPRQKYLFDLVASTWLDVGI